MTKRRKQSHLRAGVIGSAVAAGTLVAMFALPPEEVRVRAADGRMTLEGTARADANVGVRVHEAETADFTAITGDIYEVRVSGQVSPLPFRLTMTDQPGSVLYRLDRATGSWEPLPAVFDSVDRRIEADVAVRDGSRFATGSPVTKDVPGFARVLADELVSFAPERAVGYRAFVSYADIPGDFVLLEPRLEAGGCGGAFASGTDRTFTSKDRAENTGVVRVGVIWELGAGCEPGERLESAR